MHSSVIERGKRAQQGTYQQVTPTKPASIADHVRETLGMIGDDLDGQHRDELRKSEAEEEGLVEVIHDQGPTSADMIRASHLFRIRPFEPARLNKKHAAYFKTI